MKFKIDTARSDKIVAENAKLERKQFTKSLNLLAEAHLLLTEYQEYDHAYRVANWVKSYARFKRP